MTTNWKTNRITFTEASLCVRPHFGESVCVSHSSITVLGVDASGHIRYSFIP